MPTEEPIYLDYNATTPIADEVVEAMLPYLRSHFGNPSSSHAFGHHAKAAVDLARSQVADLIGAHPDEIIFTASGSEADNMAVLGTAALHAGPGRVACSAIEHPAVLKPCRHLAAQGWGLDILQVDHDGRVDVAAAANGLQSHTALVSVMHSNNEVGSLQPIAQLAQLAHDRGARLHCDAAQSIGKIAIDVDELGVDMLTLVGHKIYAPKGIGALYLRRGTPLAPLMYGGGQEHGLRPGTENVALIAALGAACALAARRLAEDHARLALLRDRLWLELQAGVPGILLNGPVDHRLPTTLNVSFPEVRGSALLAAAPAIAASTGSACHEGGETPSDVLTAMGFDHDRALGAVRLSVGRPTGQSDVDAAAAALVAAWHQISGHPVNRCAREG